MRNFFKDIGYKVISGFIGAGILAFLAIVDVFPSHWLEEAKLFGYAVILIVCGVLYYVVIFFQKKSKEKKEIKAKEELIKSSLGEKKSLEEFDSTFPEIKKIAVIGLASVGKTTLIEHLCRKKVTNKVTRGKPCAYIYNFSSTSNKYAALIDGEGQSIFDQVDIAKKADFIILLFDHNMHFGETDLNIDQVRIHEQQNFLNQLIWGLEKKEKLPTWIHILLNKKDLWSGSDDKSLIIKLHEDAGKKLDAKFSRRGTEVTKAPHSNSLANDITHILSKIEERLK